VHYTLGQKHIHKKGDSCRSGGLHGQVNGISVLDFYTSNQFFRTIALEKTILNEKWISKDGWYNRKNDFFNKLGWTFNFLTFEKIPWTIWGIDNT
jgi:hypothetical protein